MTEIKGPKPLFGEGLYEVETTKGAGMLWYSDEDSEWFNVEINDKMQPLEGDVTLIVRKVHEVNIQSAETTEVH